MRLWIQITPGAREPIYAQIVSQISRAIAAGDLSPADKLPAVRALAAELTVNPNTVARAYSVLEAQGLLTTRPGSGTWIADPASRTAGAAGLNILAERIDAIVADAINLGLTQTELLDLLKSRLASFGPNKGEPAR